MPLLRTMVFGRPRPSAVLLVLVIGLVCALAARRVPAQEVYASPTVTSAIVDDEITIQYIAYDASAGPDTITSTCYGPYGPNNGFQLPTAVIPNYNGEYANGDVVSTYRVPINLEVGQYYCVLTFNNGGFPCGDGYLYFDLQKNRQVAPGPPYVPHPTDTLVITFTSYPPPHAQASIVATCVGQHQGYTFSMTNGTIPAESSFGKGSVVLPTSTVLDTYICPTT